MITYKNLNQKKQNKLLIKQETIFVLLYVVAIIVLQELDNFFVEHNTCGGKRRYPRPITMPITAPEYKSYLNNLYRLKFIWTNDRLTC